MEVHKRSVRLTITSGVTLCVLAVRSDTHSSRVLNSQGRCISWIISRLVSSECHMITSQSPVIVSASAAMHCPYYSQLLLIALMYLSSSLWTVGSLSSPSFSATFPSSVTLTCSGFLPQISQSALLMQPSVSFSPPCSRSNPLNLLPSYRPWAHLLMRIFKDTLIVLAVMKASYQTSNPVELFVPTSTQVAWFMSCWWFNVFLFVNTWW